MSTLKNKRFLHQRKRRLPEPAPVACGGSPVVAGQPASIGESSREGPSSSSTPARIKDVRFSSTLDLITKPYLPSQTDAETLDQYHNDIWYTVSCSIKIVIL